MPSRSSRGVVGDEVIEHHGGALLHRRIVGPLRQIRHGKKEQAHVVRAVVLALAARGGQSDPRLDPPRRFAHILRGRLTREPLVAALVRPQLRHQIEGRVVQKPVVLRVAPVGHVSLERAAQGLPGRGG